MQLHNIQPKHRTKKPKRVGRGGKRGTYSGRGIKGQKARAGRKLQPSIREIIKRYPKLKGYRFKSKGRFTVAINLAVLEKKFADGEKVTPQILLKKQIIGKIKGRMPEVKILGKGELTKKFIIEGCLVSKGAREKIERTDGTVK